MTHKEFIQKASRVFDTEIAELQRVQQHLGTSFVQAVEVIHENVTKKGKKVLTVGVGKCSYIAAKIAATLASTGTTAMALDSINALHGDLGVVADGDVIIALSYSGETEEMLNFLEALRRFDVTIIAMTGNPKSQLGTRSDITIETKVEKEACPLELAPTSSTTAMLVLGDALAMVLLEAAGFRKEDFARYHPGGSIGRKLLMTAQEMMRGIDEIAMVTEGSAVDYALEEMTAHRAGAAVVVGNDGKVAGIFTHGDFVRAFRTKGGGIAERPVDDFMSRNPVTTNVDCLAVEVVGVLKKHRIDEIIVADHEGRPVGMVDVQDLSRLKIV